MAAHCSSSWAKPIPTVIVPATAAVLMFIVSDSVGSDQTLFS